MNMKSLKTQFIGAIAMVLVAAIAMGSSTYAWFSMNSKVTVTGMTVTTRVNDNLLIAEAANDTATATLNGPIASMPADAAYGTHIVQRNTAELIEPVSSATALYDSFWYTNVLNVNSKGDAKTDAYIDYDAEGLATSGSSNAFNVNYGITASAEAVGYVDYVFAIQATNTDTANAKYLNLSNCTLTFKQVGSAAADTTGHAFRVGILRQDMASAGVGSSASTTVTPVAILGDSSAAYFGSADDGAEEAVSGAAAFNSVATLFKNAASGETGVTVAEVAAGTTQYYKITVRVWLEGEDQSCTNATYATLKDGSWNLDLAFNLESGQASSATATVADTVTVVNAISKASMATNAWTVTSAATTTGNVKLSGITYYAYPATGTPATIYGDADTRAATTHWYNIDGVEVHEITEFVTIS